MFKWIFALLDFCVFKVVEDGAGEDTSAVDAVLDEMGIVDESTEDEQPENTKPQDDSAEQVIEPEPEETEPEEREPSEAKEEQSALSDEDLKPLESKNPKTNERFQKVTEGYKQEKQRVNQLEEKAKQYEESFKALRDLGFNNEAAAQDLINLSEYRKVISSGDAERFKQIIADQIQQFELVHGKPVKISASALDSYTDLKEKVDALDLDEETALEIARARRVQERANRSAQEVQQQAQQEQAQSDVINLAVNEVVALEESWKSTDPDFNAVMPHLKSHIDDIKKLPPQTWVDAISIQYKAIKNALKTASTNNTPPPLRGNGHMSGKAQPASMQDAVLAEMGFE